MTITGGHRVGISGSCVIEKGKVININYINSVYNIAASNYKNTYKPTINELINKSINFTMNDSNYNINEYVKNNKEMLDEYHKFKQTDTYKNSPAYQLMEVMKEFCTTSGYYEVFIPAMRRLSPAYDVYYTQMLKSNEEFMKSHPEYCN